MRLNNSKDRSWYYLICYLDEDEFIYYITDYLVLSVENVLQKIFRRNELKKNRIPLKRTSYTVKKINIFLNNLGMSSIIISNGDNLILIEFDSTQTPEMLRSIISVGEQLGLEKNINNENNLDSKKQYYYNIDLDNNVSE